VVGVADAVGATRAELTETVTGLEVITAVAASVTWSWKFQVPVVVEVVVVKV
jgi:hypothetical protein